MWYHFSSAWRTCFYGSCSEVLLVEKIFHFCAFESLYFTFVFESYVYIYTFFCQVVYSTWIGFYFSFSTLKILHHYLLACLVPSKKSLSYLHLLLYMICIFFSLMHSRVLLLPLCLISLNMMCLGVATLMFLGFSPRVPRDYQASRTCK